MLLWNVYDCLQNNGLFFNERTQLLCFQPEPDNFDTIRDLKFDSTEPIVYKLLRVRHTVNGWTFEFMSDWPTLHLPLGIDL